MFNNICQILGRPLRDLFAMKQNTKLQIYISPIADPQAWKVDALVQSWNNRDAYAHPPTTLIRPCLNKVCRSDCTKLAKPGMVHRHIGPSGPKANQTTTLKNTSETNILTQDSPVPGNVTLTLVEAICEQTQKGGFSEAVSKRIAKPHRNSTSKLYESKCLQRLV